MGRGGWVVTKLGTVRPCRTRCLAKECNSSQQQEPANGTVALLRRSLGASELTVRCWVQRVE